MKELAEHTEFEAKESERTWWEENWKKVVVGGICCVVTAGGIYLITKNWDQFLKVAQKTVCALKPSSTTKIALEESLASPVTVFIPEKAYKTPSTPYDVSSHIRNLPIGQHPSAKKVAEAEALGILLLPSQTLVDAYVKGICVA